MTTPALVSAGTVADDTNSVTPAFGAETTAGNLLLAWAWTNNPSGGGEDGFPISIDSTSTEDGWVFAGPSGTAYNWNGLWYKPDCGSDEAPPTFTDSGYTLFSGLAEFSGVATSSPLDQVGVADGSDPCTAEGVDSAAGDLIAALTTWNGANSGPSFSQDISGSSGSSLTTNVVHADEDASDPPYYAFSYAVGPSSLGADANKVATTISEYENAPSSIIASFLAAS